MATYRIEWKQSALRELKGLDRQVVPRIIAAIESLPSNAFPVGVRKLAGSKHTYRLRVGEYRVVYDVLAPDLVIQVVRVRHRKDAYRT